MWGPLLVHSAPTLVWWRPDPLVDATDSFHQQQEKLQNYRNPNYIPNSYTTMFHHIKIKNMTLYINLC